MANEESVLLEAEKSYQKQYRQSRWWIEHRDGLRRAGVVAFIVVDALFVGFAGWAFVDAYLVRYADETRAVLELASYGQSDLHAFTTARAAKALKAVAPIATVSSAGKYDLYATVSNPNKDWWAEVTYSFASSAGTTAEARAYVLPESDAPLAAYAVPSVTSPRGLELNMTGVAWHRIDHHETGDPAAWIANRVSFEITNATFAPIQLDGTPASPSGAASASTSAAVVGRSSFTIRNASAYGYYDPALTVLLMRGSTIVGVTGTTLPSIEAGESQDVSVNWFGPIPNVTQVKVIAQVNPFDMASYKALAGETTEDTRTRVLLRR